MPSTKSKKAKGKSQGGNCRETRPAPRRSIDCRPRAKRRDPLVKGAERKRNEDLAALLMATTDGALPTPEWAREEAGRLLKRYRVDLLKISGAKAAEEVGVPPSQFANFESGHKSMTAAALRWLCKELGLGLGHPDLPPAIRRKIWKAPRTGNRTSAGLTYRVNLEVIRLLQPLVEKAED